MALDSYAQDSGTSTIGDAISGVYFDVAYTERRPVPREQDDKKKPSKPVPNHPADLKLLARAVLRNDARRCTPCKKVAPMLVAALVGQFE